VLGYALRRTEDPQDAADVVAETFLVAWRRLEDLPPGDEARLWLYGVARRALADQRRGQRRRSALGERLRAELAMAGLPQRPQHDDAGPGSGFGVIAAALKSLPEPDRELLTLVGWEGLDHGQLATVLGCSRNTIRVRLHRARRRFARALRSHADGHDVPLPAIWQVLEGDPA
jgi:RNA polymerase sigma-70 factor (ECF subfamily)